MPAPRSGIRRRILIQSATLTTDEYGDEQEDWSDGAEIWATIRAETADERMRSGRAESRQAAAFTVLAGGTSLTSSMRIVDGSDTWEITGVREVPGTPRFLEITAVKVE